MKRVIAAARPHIKIEQVRFNGGTAFDDDGKAFIPHPEPIDYEGSGPDVDHAWDVLTGGSWTIFSLQKSPKQIARSDLILFKNVGRYVRITEEEAHEAWGEDISPFWERRANAYVAG